MTRMTLGRVVENTVSSDPLSCPCCHTARVNNIVIYTSDFRYSGHGYSGHSNYSGDSDIVALQTRLPVASFKC